MGTTSAIVHGLEPHHKPVEQYPQFGSGAEEAIVAGAGAGTAYRTTVGDQACSMSSSGSASAVVSTDQTSLTPGSSARVMP